MSNRKEYIDIAKGIGILAVVIGHVYLPALGHKVIFMFHMPLFLFITGMFFHRRNISTDIKKQFMHVLLPLSFFTLIFVPVQVWKDYYGMMGSLPYRGLQPSNFKFAITNVPLWYLKVIFILYWINYGIDFIAKYSSVVAKILTILFIAIAYYCCLTFSGLNSSLKQILICSGFYFCGYWLKSIIDAHVENKLLLGTAFTGFVVALFLLDDINLQGAKIPNNALLFYIGTFGGIMTTICISKLIEKNQITGLHKGLEFLGRNSLYIFGLHWPLINIVNYYIPQCRTSLIYSLPLAIAMLLFSIYFGKLLSKISFGLLPELK